MGALLWSLLGLAWAEPGAVGESLSWSVHYLGLEVGEASTVVSAGPGEARTIVGIGKSLSWYRAIYNMDDRVQSTWWPGRGSSAYITRFREGGFHQDQVMQIRPEEIVVERSQRFDEGWKSWTDRYEGPGRWLQDPQTTFFFIRRLPLQDGDVYSLDVFSGSRVSQMQLQVLRRETMKTDKGPQDCVVLLLQSPHDKDLKGKGKLEIRLSDDALRLPLAISWRSKILGTVRVELESWSSPAQPQESAG